MTVGLRSGLIDASQRLLSEHFAEADAQVRGRVQPLRQDRRQGHLRARGRFFLRLRAPPHRLDQKGQTDQRRCVRKHVILKLGTNVATESHRFLACFRSDSVIF